MLSSARQSVFQARERFRVIVDRLDQAVRSPLRAVENVVQRFNSAQTEFEYSVSAAAENVASLTKLLNSLSPRNVLKRGYSITRDSSGKAVKDASSVQKGAKITTHVERGQLSSTVD